jgi:hypothetical protein
LLVSARTDVVLGNGKPAIDIQRQIGARCSQ